MTSKFRSITLITSPYHVGIRDLAVGAGPSYLKNRGILNAIRSTGISLDEIEVQPVQNDFEGDIARSFEIFRRTSNLVRQAHDNNSFPIILAGNCSSSIGVLSGISNKVRASGEKAACVWFDAHDDFNTPDTMTSGYFDSMPIAMLGNLCFKSLLETVPDYTPLDLKRLIHVGMRDVNDIERRHVEEYDLSVVWGDTEKKIDFDQGLKTLLHEKDLRSQPTMVHFDVDSLDTSIGQANRFAAPGGLSRKDALDCISRVARTTTPMSLTVASIDPSFHVSDSIADVAIEAVVLFTKTLKEKTSLEV